MRRQFSLFLGLVGCLFSSILAADSFIEARGNYPSLREFRKFYENTGTYGLEFDFQAVDQFYGWVGAYYGSHNGKTIHDKNQNRVALLPVNLGMKYIAMARLVQPYIGVGAETTYLRDRGFGARRKENWGLGPIFKGGLIVNASERSFIDVYADYSLMGMHWHKNSDKYVVIEKKDVSGFSFGGGFGRRF
jgi:outer membrane protein W